MSILEGKDLAKFAGDIHKAKKRAINTAARLTKPVLYRNKLEKSATQELDALLGKAERKMNRIHRKFLNGDILADKFKKEMIKTLRDVYFDAYRLGAVASGLVRVDDLSAKASKDEMDFLKKILSEEGKYFTRFLSDIVRGTSRTKVTKRIANYMKSVRSVFQASKVLQLPDLTIIHWVLESKNPCPDCRLLHRMSPYTKDTLPTTPKGGSTRCLHNCYCALRLVKAKNKNEIFRIKKKHKSATAVIKKLEKNRKKV